MGGGGGGGGGAKGQGMARQLFVCLFVCLGGGGAKGPCMASCSVHAPTVTQYTSTFAASGPHDFSWNQKKSLTYTVKYRVCPGRLATHHLLTVPPMPISP